MITEDDLKTLNEFIKIYPTWWYKIGVCDISRDFTAAPQSHSPEAKFICLGNDFDHGFSSDHSGSISDAIKSVIKLIERAINEIPRI